VRKRIFATMSAGIDKTERDRAPTISALTIKRDFSVPIYYAREMFPDCATRHYCYLLPFN